MYGTHSFDEKVVTTNNRNEDYDLCDTETGQKYIIQWSPQNGTQYLSSNRYAIPRSLSKSVPRRNRGIARYNINRSLNFDSGMRQRSHSFKLSNISPDCKLSPDNDNYLSRSAKILRALNINYSPLKSTRLGTCRINKSLNFDHSPNSKDLITLSRSVFNDSRPNTISPLSKINKTLNFETSSEESSVNSRLDSSVESMDENENRTPSQRNRKAKKSLNYPSPKFETRNCKSPNMGIHSPMLRNELREKIDDIIQSNATPKLQSSKRNLLKDKLNDFCASTPRNLFNDFNDDEESKVEDERDIIRSQTPENVVKIIPESMSAIKKSHRKERVLGRLGKAIAYQAETCSSSVSRTDTAVDVELETSKPLTPVVTSSHHNSPQSDEHSTEESLESKKSKLYREFSDDEMSETGSIFDYTSETNKILTDVPKLDDNAQGINILQRRNSCTSEEGLGKNNSSLASEGSTHNETDKAIEDSPRRISYSPKAFQNVNELEVVEGSSMDKPQNLQMTGENTMSVTRDTTTTPEHPKTPENRVNFLQHLMTDSIKKSHKKIKDSNKKSLFKARRIDTETEEATNAKVPSDDKNGTAVENNRAATPENMNSSRLLLSQFSSVKKSHRKDKHKRMISGSLRRQKFFDGDGESVANSNDEALNSSDISCTNVSPDISSPQISSNSAVSSGASHKQSKNTTSNEFSSSENSNSVDYHSLEGGDLETKKGEPGIDKLSNLDLRKSSPIKRRNVFNDSFSSTTSRSPSSLASISVSYESAEEEFKIFTPIKKRKSLNAITPIARRICDGKDFSPERSVLSERLPMDNTARCSTPTSARDDGMSLVGNSFETPEKNAHGVRITVTDYSTPVLRNTENTNSDSNSGRATPQNQSTAALMADINSIKKSHKKDKRCHVSRAFLISAQENEYESEFTSNLENNPSQSSHSQICPRPSTSYEHTDAYSTTDPDNEASRRVKTPPNCLQAKNYIKLLQSESIKRSHKKVRQRRKYTSAKVDAELSDSGSIFDEAERSVDLGN